MTSAVYAKPNSRPFLADLRIKLDIGEVVLINLGSLCFKDGEHR
jgi:hypothetical protein